jgi:hypothetical protein
MRPAFRRALFVSGVLVACASVSAARLDRAGEILAQAREAIGGEARLRAVTSLSLKASERRTGSSVYVTRAGAARMDNRETQSDVEIQIALPARYVLTRTWPGSVGQHFSGILGDRLIGETSSMGETTPDRFIGGPDLVARVATQRVRELLRYMLAWLLMAPDQYNVQFSDAGEADAANGRADVLDAKGAYDFAARLFFDKQTHHLLMLNYQEPPRQASAAAAPAPPTRPPEKGEPLFRSIEAPPTSWGNMQIRLADYRPVDGIMLPHHMTIDEGSVREWRVSRFEVNPALNWKRFERR